MACDLHAITVVEDRGGHAEHLIVLHRARVDGVGRWVCDAQLGEEVHRALARAQADEGPDVHTHEQEVGAVAVMDALEGRHLGTAGWALAGPEVEHHRRARAEQRREVDLIATQEGGALVGDDGERVAHGSHADEGSGGLVG